MDTMPPRAFKSVDLPAEVNDLSGAIVDAAVAVHSRLGPGLLESAYRECLAYELRKRGHYVAQEVPMPLRYDGVILEVGYRMDLLVDDQVVLELKATDGIHPVHVAQLLTYLKLAGKPLGILLNFHAPLMKKGIRRIANTRR